MTGSREIRRIGLGINSGETVVDATDAEITVDPATLDRNRKAVPRMKLRLLGVVGAVITKLSVASKDRRARPAMKLMTRRHFLAAQTSHFILTIFVIDDDVMRLADVAAAS